MKRRLPTDLPKVSQIEKELSRERYKRQYRRTLRGTVYMLITVAAAAILIATLWLPVLRIYGDSMTPTLTGGDIVVSVKTDHFTPGDIVCFYYNNKILVKRVIAMPGDWVDIGQDGTVSINGEPLDEPYLTEKALGNCDIELPYQVPESRVFVIGDHRSVSVDSRNAAVGCIAQEQIVGKLVFRVWPMSGFGPM
ncbi:MAG: signal peptidase I [Eubacteriales bacterium]|nr:signal peptidase I [Eubacteriales bacterium]